MKNLTLLFVFLITHSSLAQKQSDRPHEDLEKLYEKLVGETAKRPPRIEEIFKHSYKCGGFFGQREVTEADNKVASQLKTQHSTLSKDKLALSGVKKEVEKAIEEAFNKNKLKPADLAKVDICKGGKSSIEKTFADAKNQAQIAAHQKIDSLAKELANNNAHLRKLIDKQMQVNSNDKTKDLSGIYTAKLVPGGGEDKQKACDVLTKFVSSDEANKSLAAYRGELQNLGKKISPWQNEMKEEIGAEIEQQVAAAKQQMVRGMVCEEDKAHADGPKESSISQAKSDAPPSAPKKEDSGAEVAKSDLDKKPEALAKEPRNTTPAHESDFNATPVAQTEAVKPLSAPKGENTASDTAQKVFTESSYEDLVTGKNDLDRTGYEPKPAAASSNDLPAVQALDDAPQHGKYSPLVGDNFYSNDYVNERMPAIPEAAEVSISKDSMEIKGLALDSQSDVTGAPGDKGAAAAAPVVATSGSTPSWANDYSPTPADKNTLRNNYYSTANAKGQQIATPGENIRLDFNSKKDATYIQKALNQVSGQRVAVDGVVGSRTIGSLSSVMSNPTQKAEFLKALKAAMGGRATASR